MKKHYLKKIFFLTPAIIFSIINLIYSDTVTITVPLWFSPTPENRCIQEIYDDYKEANKGVEIKVNALGGNTEKYTNTIYLMIDSGKTTDLAIVPTKIVGELSKSGHLLNLTGIITESKENDFIAPLLHICKVDDQLFGLPYDTDVMVIYYNKKIFKQYGISDSDIEKDWDWNKLLTLGEILTKDENDKGEIDTWGFGFPAGRFMRFIDYFLPWYYSAGGIIDRERGIPVRSDPVFEVLNLYRKMVLVNKISPPATPSYLGKDIYKGLINNHFAMAITGSWVYYSIQQKGDFGILPIPPMKHGQKSYTYCGGWSVIIFKKGESQNRISLDFADVLTSEKSMILKWREKHFLPTLKTVLENKELKEKWPDSFFAEQLLGHAYSLQSTGTIEKKIMKIQDAGQYILIKNYQPKKAIEKVLK